MKKSEITKPAPQSFLYTEENLPPKKHISSGNMAHLNLNKYKLP